MFRASLLRCTVLRTCTLQAGSSSARGFTATRVVAALNSKEKKALRALANNMQQKKKLNIMQVGKNGITDGVKVALDQALTARELVKIKVGENSDDTEEDVAEVLAGDVNAEVVGMVGHTVLLARLKPKGESAIRPALDAILNETKLPSQQRGRGGAFGGGGGGGGG